jgi:DNA-directed RNA polymerase specialized sigma24 family protein
MVSEDFLRERAQVAAEEIVSSDSGRAKDDAIDVDKRKKLDEKLEADLNTDEGVWSREEVEFLVNNRESMGNDELKEFLERRSDFQSSGFEPFSESEEEVILRSFPGQSAAEIAERLDRDVEMVEKKLKMLGFDTGMIGDGEAGD